MVLSSAALLLLKLLRQKKVMVMVSRVLPSIEMMMTTGSAGTDTNGTITGSGSVDLPVSVVAGASAAMETMFVTDISEMKGSVAATNGMDVQLHHR